MEQFLIDVVNRFGYIGVAFLIAVENIFPPIPSEVILTFAGFLTTVSGMNVWGVIVFATVGSVAGALALYYLGRLLNAQRLERLFDSKLGKRFHLKKTDVRKAEGWFLRHGNKTVFYCRFIPIVRSLISVPAGAAQMKMGTFLLLTATGTGIWNIVLVFLGKFAGESWRSIVGYLDVYSTVAIVVAVLFVAVAAAIFIRTKFRKKQKTAGKSKAK